MAEIRKCINRLSFPSLFNKPTLCNLQRMTTLSHILNHSTFQPNWVTRLCELELSSLNHYPFENTDLLIHDYAGKNFTYSSPTRLALTIILSYLYVYQLQSIFYILHFTYLYANTYKYIYKYMCVCVCVCVCTLEITLTHVN